MTVLSSTHIKKIAVKYKITCSTKIMNCKLIIFILRLATIIFANQTMTKNKKNHLNWHDRFI